MLDQMGPRDKLGPMFPIRDHNPSGRVPFVTWALIAANIIVFLWSWVLQPSEQATFQLLYEWGMVPAYLSSGQGWITPFTSMFLHGGWLHLAGNMLFLWIFGDNIEDTFGHFKYLAFYIASGLAAALLQYLADPWSQITVVGASGAIAGVLGGYLFLFPKARVDILLILVIFFKVFSLPAWIVLGLWFAMQLLGGFSAPTEDGGVAYWAHAGGFIAGIAIAWRYWSRHGGQRYWRVNQGQPPHPAAKYTPWQK